MSFHEIQYFILDGVPTLDRCLGNQTPESVVRNIAEDKFIVKIAGHLPDELLGAQVYSHEHIKDIMQGPEWLG